MSLFSRFQALSEADKSRAVQKLVTSSTADFDFFLFVILSVLMATFGLLIDEAAVVIGSMLIAPILYPVLSLSLGLAMSDGVLIGRSFYTIVKSVALGVSAAALATLFFSSSSDPLTGEIIRRIEPTPLYLAVAVASGIAVAYALMRPNLNATLPGVAVSVALIPPLAVIGIGIARFEWETISGSAVLLGVNILGIVFASLVSFSLMNLYTKRKVAETTVKEEEARVEREAEKIKEIDSKKDSEDGTPV